MPNLRGGVRYEASKMEANGPYDVTFVLWSPPPQNLCRLEPESLITVPLLPLRLLFAEPFGIPGEIIYQLSTATNQHFN